MTDAATLQPRPGRIELARITDFHFGGLRIRPARRQVCLESGECHELEPRIMQVLVALAAARGEVVSRDELIESCWDGLAVGDDSINRCIVALRRLARSIDPEPFSLETVTRVGYSLIERQSARAQAKARWRRLGLIGIAAAMAAAAVALALWWMRPSEPPGPPQVRLASIRLLSPDLPPATVESFSEQLTAAFQAEGALMVVAPDAADAAPRHSVSATIQKAGDRLRFAVHLRNERSGALLWSQMFERPARSATAPGEVAAEVSRVVRCGLATAGPQLASMTDPNLYLWLRYCASRWSGGPSTILSKLDTLRRLTAAAPDFAPGWAARAFLAVLVSREHPTVRERRAEATQAAARALRLDPRNSEAYAALGIGRVELRDFAGAEAYLRRAVSVRPTDCGCEHNVYGQMLAAVGRTDDAIDHFRRAQDMDPLAEYSSVELAHVLLADGRPEGRRILRNIRETWPDSPDLPELQLQVALLDGNYPEALRLLADPRLERPAAVREAVGAAFRAIMSGDARRRREAAPPLIALVRDPTASDWLVTAAIALLGENRAALASVERDRSLVGGVLFEPFFAAARRDPAFAPLAERLGLVRYWRQTGRRPDVCRAADAPGFCRML
jgi:DNA-binding winged helix-turn-helix (wHTH) protein/tetratricopeptide (TPR) repeat protein